MAMADGLGDGREPSGRGDHVSADKLVPFDLQQLSFALRVETWKASRTLALTESRVQVSAAYNSMDCTRV